jgi:multidrug efflux pump subunit AcrA (membrane-fusion protein)
MACMTLLLGCDSSTTPSAEKNPVTTQGKTQGHASAATLSSPDEVVGIGRVEPEGEIIPLASNEPGIVTKTYVQQGDTVKAGDLLLELDHSILSAQIDQVRRRAATQAARIKTDEKSLIDAQIRLSTLKANAAKTENLVKGGAETGQNLVDQKNQILLQENDVLRWQAVLEADRAQLREIEGEGIVLGQQTAQRMARAPFDGRILAFRALPGSYIRSESPFADFAPDGRTMVRGEIDELFAHSVSAGQKAIIVEIGTHKELARGHVVYVSDFLKRKSLFSENAGEMEDRRVREVRVIVDSGAKMLINSRVECHIQTPKAAPTR